MRLRTGLSILVAVNVLWAAAFFGYVQRSTTPVMKAGLSAKRSDLPKTNPSVPTIRTNPAPVGPIGSPAPSNSIPSPVIASGAPALTNLVLNGRQYGWQDVTNDIYLQYIASLRSVGCPDKQVRGIVVTDVNDLFDKRRLEHAIKTDSQWWKAETFMGVLPMQNFGGVNFDDERRILLTKLLGEGWDDTVKLAPLNGSAVNLTGPVLGALLPETWNNVQEICARSMDRHQALLTARMNEGGAMDNIEMAKMRNQTRTDLAKVLAPEQIEEFLLRFSHNSSKLRQDMRGLDLTPDEFRKIFRAIDPAEHQVQLEYGGPEALSQKQREQLDAQRDRAVREALTPARYDQYLFTKDPLYRQAQMMASQYGMNGKAVRPLYELTKASQAKQLQIAQNTALTPGQRQQATQAAGQEQQQALQKLLGDVTYRQ